MWLLIFTFFLNSANLICRDTEISKYFRESLWPRDNESRLYTTMCPMIPKEMKYNLHYVTLYYHTQLLFYGCFFFFCLFFCCCFFFFFFYFLRLAEVRIVTAILFCRLVYCHMYSKDPQRYKVYLLTCAPNEDSNQPAHPHSQISLPYPHEEALQPLLSKMRPEKILLILCECTDWPESSMIALVWR